MERSQRSAFEGAAALPVDDPRSALRVAILDHLGFGPSHVRDLTEFLQLHGDHGAIRNHDVVAELDSLIEAGVVASPHWPASNGTWEQFEDVAVELSSSFLNMLRGIGISPRFIFLAMFQRIRSASFRSSFFRDEYRRVFSDGDGARPFFGRSHRPSDVFCVFPFDDDKRARVERLVMMPLRSRGISVTLASEYRFSDMIVRDIYRAIAGSMVVVADCSGLNPNVVYEVGIAHALSRDVVLVTNDVANVPFDLKHLRFNIWPPERDEGRFVEDIVQQVLLSVDPVKLASSE